MTMPGSKARFLEGFGFFALTCLPGAGALLALLVADSSREEAKEEAVAIDSAPDPAPGRTRLAAGAVDLSIALALGAIPYLGWLAAVVFLVVRDHRVLGGRSPGKRLLGLRRIGPSGLADHLRRNLTVALPGLQFLLVPVESLLLLRGKTRLGDRWARTRVVREP